MSFSILGFSITEFLALATTLFAIMFTIVIFVDEFLISSYNGLILERKFFGSSKYVYKDINSRFFHSDCKISDGVFETKNGQCDVCGDDNYFTCKELKIYWALVLQNQFRVRCKRVL